MKVLITGASGFLGSHLIGHLLECSDAFISALSSRPEILRARFPGDMERLTIVSDIPSSFWKETDVLINCAFPRNSDAEKMPKGMKFISDLFRDAASGGVRAVINISSQSVYSQKRREAADEESPLCLESPYAVGKYASELLLNAICKNLPHTNIRLASLIGPGFEQRIINRFVSQAVNGTDLHIVGGQQTFGFLDVRDAAAGLARIMESDPALWQEVYNLGPSESCTLEEIAALVCRYSSVCCTKPIRYATEAADVWQNSALDCSRFMKQFSWKPKYTLADTIQTIYEERTILRNDVRNQENEKRHL